SACHEGTDSARLPENTRNLARQRPLPDGITRTKGETVMKPMMLALMLGLMMLALGGLVVSPAEALNCGDTLGPGGSFTLTADVGPCTPPAGLFVAGPVTVNLNGHTVTCDTSGGGNIGIDIQGSGAVLKNGLVILCNTGVQIEGNTSHVRNV